MAWRASPRRAAHQGLWDAVERFVRAAREQRPGGVSVADFLARLAARDASWARDGEAVTAYVSGFHAADVRAMSVAALVREEDAGGDEAAGDARLIDGYDALVRYLAAGLDPARDRVLLGTEAREVRRRAGRVEVALLGARDGVARPRRRARARAHVSRATAAGARSGRSGASCSTSSPARR